MTTYNSIFDSCACLLIAFRESNLMTLKAQSTQETENLTAIIDNSMIGNTAQSSQQLSYRQPLCWY
ncbi:MAG: hypothetical protein ACI9VL_001297 [Colwellia sp.]|jgi:hypothetical protein